MHMGKLRPIARVLARLLCSAAHLSNAVQSDCVRWYEQLMRRTYQSLLNFGDGLDFFPQGGPIKLDGFEEYAVPHQ